MKRKDIDRRTISSTFSLRADGGENESRTITGHAALFNVWSEDLGGFIEQIRPGAFGSADFSDVRMLKNHDPNIVYARTKSGTLDLSIDEKGLFFRFEAPPTVAGDELLYDVKSGNVDQASFAFTLADRDDADEVDFSGDVTKRYINHFGKIYDTSIVTYPAYSETVVSGRSMESVKGPEKEPEKENEEEKAINLAPARLKLAQALKYKNELNKSFEN